MNKVTSLFQNSARKMAFIEVTFTTGRQDTNNIRNQDLLISEEGHPIKSLETDGSLS